MNIASNPWSFVAGDVATPVVVAVASPNGMIQQGTTAGEQALGTVLLTTTAAHGLLAGQYMTYIGDSNGRFNGFYKVIAVPTATTALLQNISSPSSGRPFNTILAASGGGTVLLNQVQQMVRAEDISIQATQAADTAGDIIILDRNGNLIWRASVGVTPTGTGSLAQNRGKIFWVDGLTLQSIPAGYTVLVTVN